MNTYRQPYGVVAIRDVNTKCSDETEGRMINGGGGGNGGAGAHTHHTHVQEGRARSAVGPTETLRRKFPQLLCLVFNFMEELETQPRVLY